MISFPYQPRNINISLLECTLETTETPNSESDVWGVCFPTRFFPQKAGQVIPSNMRQIQERPGVIDFTRCPPFSNATPMRRNTPITFKQVSSQWWMVCDWNGKATRKQRRYRVVCCANVFFPGDWPKNPPKNKYKITSYYTWLYAEEQHLIRYKNIQYAQTMINKYVYIYNVCKYNTDNTNK